MPALETDAGVRDDAGADGSVPGADAGGPGLDGGGGPSDAGRGGPDGASVGVPDAASAGDAGVGAGGFAEVVPSALWDAMFPERNALYTHDALVAAAAYYPAFCAVGSAETRLRECAAFLANIAHETTGGWDTAPGGRFAWGLYFVQEVGCESGACVAYCDASSARYPCAPGRTYHGRGPLQLSWNYNYGQAGEALGLDLLGNPDLVVSDGVTAFRTALWFWMTAQSPKPSAHDVMSGTWAPSAADAAAGRAPGFGMTINIINGGLECGVPTSDRVRDRIGFYERFVAWLGTTSGANVECDTMRSY